MSNCESGAAVFLTRFLLILKYSIHNGRFIHKNLRIVLHLPTWSALVLVSRARVRAALYVVRSFVRSLCALLLLREVVAARSLRVNVSLSISRSFCACVALCVSLSYFGFSVFALLFQSRSIWYQAHSLKRASRARPMMATTRAATEKQKKTHTTATGWFFEVLSFRHGMKHFKKQLTMYDNFT